MGGRVNHASDQLVGSSARCPQATLRCQCRNPRPPRAIGDLAEIEAEPTAPIRMFVRRTGKVRLLAFTDNIFQLNQHQAGARACEIAQDRVAELRCVGRRSAIGEKFTKPLGCKQPLLDERLSSRSRSWRRFAASTSAATASG